jgi:hypothetical protein
VDNSKADVLFGADATQDARGRLVTITAKGRAAIELTSPLVRQIQAGRVRLAALGDGPANQG